MPKDKINLNSMGSKNKIYKVERTLCKVARKFYG
jgi:hypothetical protein